MGKNHSTWSWCGWSKSQTGSFYCIWVQKIKGIQPITLQFPAFQKVGGEGLRVGRKPCMFSSCGSLVVHRQLCRTREASLLLCFLQTLSPRRDRWPWSRTGECFIWVLFYYLSVLLCPRSAEQRHVAVVHGPELPDRHVVLPPPVHLIHKTSLCSTLILIFRSNVV